MPVLRVLLIVSLLIFIEDVTGIEKRTPIRDDEIYTSGSSGSGHNSNCDDVYTNYSDFSFQHELASLSSDGLINITTDVTLMSIMTLVGLENIRITGHNNPTVNCDDAGGIHFYHCHNCTILGITWEKCGDIYGNKPAIELYNCSDMIIENCTFQHSMTQAIALSEMLGNMTISGCMFAFNNHYEEHGTAIHYLSKTNLYSNLQFTISECNFTRNGMNSSQSVVYIGPSSNKSMEQISLTNSVFVNNQGTPLYISHQDVFANGNILFKGNVAGTMGGGIFIGDHTKIIFDNSDIEFTYNEALNGGALYIDNNSDVTFGGNCAVTINNNYARSLGGALYIGGSSDVTFEGNCTVTISNNYAAFWGGAFFISFYSYVTFQGYSTVAINNNYATSQGGAFVILFYSKVILEGNSAVTINDNIANDQGGAFYITFNSNVIFEGKSTVTIYNNQAGSQGGALWAVFSDVTFKENCTVTINNNQAISERGGALYIGSYSTIAFEGNSVITITNNKANGHDGGGLYVSSYSNVVFKGNSTIAIDNNQAAYFGGALCIVQYSVVTFGENSVVAINKNLANFDAGAIYIYFNSNVFFEENSVVTITDNEGTYHGGAFVIGSYSDVTFGGNSIVTINNNLANVDGGAIYIDNSSITFQENCTVAINDNVANDDGGGLYVSHYSNVIFEGSSMITVNNNQAMNWGGAFWVFYNSDITFKENSTVAIDNNTAYNDGGAFYIVANCDVLLEENSSVTISNNQAKDYGGALNIQQNSNVVIEGNSEVEFYNNTAKADGGVLYAEVNCNATIKGHSVVIFDNNVALGDGGVVFSRINSDITFQENSTVKFNDNRANYFGGALCYKQNSNIIFEHNCTVTFDRNTASQGGAIFSMFNIVFTDSSTVRFANNEALLGGAAYFTHLTFKGNTAIMFNNNKAVLNGGALYSDHSSIIVKQKPTLTFTQNNAENGGAIFTSTLLVSDQSDVTFNRNTAEQDGGAIYLNDEGDLIFDNSSTVTLISNTADNYGGAIYSNITQNTKYFNISDINFSDNTADVAGNLPYIDVPKSCDTNCLTDRTVGINGILQDSLVENEIATSPRTLKLHHPAKYIDNDTVECENYYIDNIMLGQEVTIHACVLDYYSKPAEVTQFKIIGENHQNYYIQGSEYASISCNHTIEGVSIVGNKSISDLPLQYSVLFTSMLHNAFKSTRKIISVYLTVRLSPCHPAFQYNSESQKCECYSNNEIVFCSGSNSTIKRGYWFGQVTGIQTVTFCPINYCNFTCCKTTNGYYHLSPVRVNQCRLHRSGSACGNCEEGYTLSFDSPECISNNKCTTGQTILVVTLTVFYWFVVIVAVFIIMYYQLGIGYFYAVTYYYSVVDILLSQYTDLSDGLYITVTIMSSVAKVIPQFLGQLCLLKDMSGIDQQFIHYLHPLVVSLILIMISWLARHFKRFADFVSRGIIHAICFLLLLSYTSVATTSLLLMRSLRFADVDNVYTYLSPDNKYFHGRHLVYGIIAIILVVLIVIGLPLLLLLEPFLNSKVNFIRIKPLLDQFQGCYKDKYRYFAAYYMICRLIIITIIIANSSDAFIS